ncbi:MAG: xanthine dehydrogenase family protein subunit M [Deltaproteobacteria bacterium]|nr:xanthine dehydrogenase family protein subunit M [Deltaproteobacteria bacterium]
MQLDYHRPRTIEEALALLGEVEGAMPVAGATDVWVNLRAKKIAPTALVSLREVAELAGLRREGTTLVIGAATPHGVVEDCQEIAAEFPALHRACSSVGSRQVRNVGTVGGNLCNAAPSADSAVPLLLYDAECVLRSRTGTRRLPVADFFKAPGRSALAAGELLTEIRMELPGPRTWSGYWKHTRRKAMELPLLGVGALVALAEDGETVAKARIALGVAAPVPIRAGDAEAALVGQRLTRETVEAAAKIAADGAQVRDSWRGKAWYRREMIRVLIPRVLGEAGAFGNES